MEMYTSGNKLMVSVKNIPEFNALLEKAQKEAAQLNNTIDQLSRFDLVVSFDVLGNQAGDMEAASSVIKTIPTK